MNPKEVYFVLEHVKYEGIFIGFVNGCVTIVSTLEDALTFREYRKARDYKSNHLSNDAYCFYNIRMITADTARHYHNPSVLRKAAVYKRELEYLRPDVVASTVINALDNSSLYGEHMITEYFPGHGFPSPFIGYAIKKVIFNDPATIVLWKDGSKTVVKAQDGETYDPEKGLAMAISKKALGNQGNYYDVFKKHLPKEEPKDADFNKWWGVEAYPIKKGKDKAYRCSNCNRFISNEIVQFTRLNILSPCPHCGKFIGPSKQEG